MSTIAREFTKEQLQQIIETDHVQCGEASELARIALASLEAEPVAYMVGTQLLENMTQAIAYKADTALQIKPLYTAPSAPVSVPDLKPVGFLFVSDDGAVAYSPAGWPMKGFNLIGPIYGDVNACRAAMLQSGNFRENKNSSTNNFREIAETSTNYPVIPSEVLSAILKVAKIRADFDDFDGDRRGIGDCLDEAEQELIVTINKYASQLAVVSVGLDERAAFNAWNNDENLPIAGVGAKNAAWLAWQARAVLCGNSVLKVPPERPADSSSCDDVEAWFDEGWNAYRAAMLQAEPVSNSDELPLDYLQGHKDGLEWAAQLAEANHPQTGDWLYDDPIDLARAIRKGPDMPTVQGGNSPVTPDGWISCSERMPDSNCLYLCWGTYFEGDEPGYIPAYFFVYQTNGWTEWQPVEDECNPSEVIITHWMPLPAAPKQEVK